MKATVLFDRNTLLWRAHELHLSKDLIKGAEWIKSHLTELGRAQFLHVLDVELDSFEVTGEDKWVWSSSELPNTPTIEECITENKAKIVSCLNKLKRNN